MSRNEDAKENKSSNNKIDLSNLLSKSNLKLRKDLITVFILSILFIFSIFIIKKIFSNEVEFSDKISESKIIQDIELITEEILIKNYTEDKFIEKSLAIKPPFFLTIASNNNIGITIEQDTLAQYMKYLKPGTEANLEGFISSAKLLFTNTSKVKIRLNGLDLNAIKNYPYPLKLTIKSLPPSFTARLYKPL